MKFWINSIFSLLFIFSCTVKEQDETTSIVSKNSPANSVERQNNILSSKEDTPGKFSNHFTSHRIFKNTKFEYDLPPIKSIRYIPLDLNNFGSTKLYNELFVSDINNTKYRYKISYVNNPLEILDLYLICDTISDIYKKHSRKDDDFPARYGFLMIYNQESMHANVVPVFFNSLKGNAISTRNFKIDSEYSLFLTDFKENGMNKFRSSDHKFSISNEGTIEHIESKSRFPEITNGVPDITKLPFDVHYTPIQMKDFTKKHNKVYKLPPICSLHYITIDSIYNDRKGKTIEDIFNFTNYRFKLPDISIYEVYVICDTTWSDYYITNNMSYYKNKIHSYLLLYEPTSVRLIKADFQLFMI